MDLGLTGRTVLITGGSRGIGAACAHSFAAEGAHLVLVARHLPALASLRDALVARHGARVDVHALDLRTPDGVAAASALCGSIDVLVNNAGDIPPGSLEAIDDTRWRAAWELKLHGYIALSRTAFVAMKARGGGVIVNVIGMAAERPTFEYICGASANAALAAFTKALGQRSLQSGVRVMGVHPPATRTERIDTIMRAAAQAKYGDPSRIDDLVKDGLASAAIDPEQVADAVVYVASKRASQLSGIVFDLGRVVI